jgi:nitrogenase molybdenum-cofactor synthesis protein NifE
MKHMNTEKPVFYTAEELAARGSNDIPLELVSTNHLIYSSPATLAFNSPGAEGYGVKRAGLAVPGSVMLIVSPGCCGRNTSAISRMPGYEDRFFYLTMNETDLVTGRHLKKIPSAVAELCRGLKEKGKSPRVVMICITCVDALLGTDMERICRRAQEKVPEVRVRPCYMYALTREGRKPPMVHVRQSIYELLEPRPKKASSVNLLGFFAPLEGSAAAISPTGLPKAAGQEKAPGQISGLASKNAASGTGSELFDILRQAGVRKIRQIGACADYDAFQEMGEANFNLVLNPEARPAAYDLQERLGIPFIEMSRFYQIDRIEAQYAALGNVLQTKFEDAVYKKEAQDAVEAFRANCPDAVFSVGEAMNGNPFELACALVREGFAVREIFGTVSRDSYVWLGILARLSPETRIYSNLHPSMLHYREEEAAASGVTISIGRDAGWYHPEAPNVQWITDIQPFGYRAVSGLYRALTEAVRSRSRGSYSSAISLGTKEQPQILQADSEAHGHKYADGINRRPLPAGFRRFTTPFAPDQSGAVSVLYDMGGICVICDAGGCTGNICGFDEPRWFGSQSAVFSAGLRDMDAILGRDDRLVEKLFDASQIIPASFAAIVGTPVPAVIGTDYQALRRMSSRKTGLPVIAVNTDGMEYYDRGLEKTYIALLEEFCRQQKPVAAAGLGTLDENKFGAAGIIGIWGYSPLDFAGILSEDDLREWVRQQGYREMICCGAGTGIEDLQKLAFAEKNIVLSPAGAAAARWLQKTYGTQWEYCIPGADRILRTVAPDLPAGPTLIVHQQVLADSLCGILRRQGIQADSASFFMMKPDVKKDHDVQLREETDLRTLLEERHYTNVIVDRSMEPVIEGLPVNVFHLPHFAVSGEQLPR